ncbi:MAG: HEPN domain-containing protein [Planctomycetota bacterium]
MKDQQAKQTQEWIRQSDYDFITAKAMFKSGRYIYTVFMCHLSVEKALKGLYREITKTEPPKIHDLINLATRINLEPPSELKGFLGHLTQMCTLRITKGIYRKNLQENIRTNQGRIKMGKRRIKEIVLRLVRALVQQQIKTEKVVLFGSQADGNYHRESDLDLVFISSDFTGRNLIERARILGNAHWEVPDYPMDLIGVTPQEWEKGDSLIISYAKNGKLIYA